MTGTLVFRCRRCSAAFAEAHPDSDVALRRAIETRSTFTVHACADGAEGLAELVGTGARDQEPCGAGRDVARLERVPAGAPERPHGVGRSG